ncbi:MAG: type II toxin-antitoxin system RelE/ParE family toxin [Muribaculaceae bacterium]|nr:type II toxin-antitoxin system RelE/ParE family toxin [Muribaculaceae bacterium]
MEVKKLNILLSDEAKTFIRLLPEKARKKVTYNILRVEGGEMSKDLFKKLNENIWELRTSYNGMGYRLLSFWDKETNALIIATHGFVKKTWKVPQKEIDRAEAFRTLYYDSKKS